jgi:hypothetical protein
MPFVKDLDWNRIDRDTWTQYNHLWLDYFWFSKNW